MNAIYGKTYRRFWDDEKVSQMDPREKLVALYLMTGQNNRCGIFRFSIGMAIEHTGMHPERFKTAFQNVCLKLGWKYSENTRMLYIPTWWKYNPPANSSHLSAILEDLLEIPQTPMLEDFKANTRYLPEHCRNRWPYTSPPTSPPSYTDTDTNTDTNSDTPLTPQGGKGPELNPVPPRGRGRPPRERLPIPDSLSVPEFVSAWARWVEHIRQKKTKWTALAEAAQLAHCVEWGPARAVAAIDHSIAGSYQGLFEPKGQNGQNGNGNGHPKPPAERHSRAESLSL